MRALQRESSITRVVLLLLSQPTRHECIACVARAKEEVAFVVSDCS